MQRTFFFIMAFCLGILYVNAQALRISGRVVDSLEHPIEVFDVRALRADSSMLAGGAFFEGSFEMELPEEAALIKVSSLGYVPAYLPLDLGKREGNVVSIGAIVLDSQPAELSEVVVSARRPLVRFSGDSYVVDIAKTRLENAGTFVDVARRIPGLVVSGNGKISVMGKPRLLINLNGRAVRNVSELQALQSRQIKSVSIDRNPSAAYSADYDAVINISTRDAIQDYVHIAAVNKFSMARKLSNSSSVTLNSRIKSLDLFTDVRFSSNGNLQYDSEEKHVWSDVQELRTSRFSELMVRHNLLDISQTAEYHFRPQTALGLGYRLSVTEQNIEKEQDYSVVSADHQALTTLPVSVHSSMKRTDHNPSLYFTNKGKNSFLGIYADYYGASLKNSQYVSEKAANRNVSQDFTDHYDVFGLKGDFSHRLSFLSYALGVKISCIKDRGTYLSGYEDTPDSRLESRSFATYVNLRKTVGKVSFAAGLRYEREHSQSSDNDRVVSDTVYNHLFPYLSIAANGSVKASLSYSRRIYRPTYNQLIVKSVYIDPLSYSIGNPLLKSALVDIVSFSVQKGIFAGTVSYEQYHNKKAQVAVLEERNGTQRVRFTYDNIPHVHRLVLYTMCNYGTGNIRGNTTLMLSSSRMNYEGVAYSTFKDIGLYLKSNLETSLWKGASSMLSAAYRNAQHNDFYYHRASFNFSLYLTQDLFQNRLRISVQAEDIFKTARVNNWVQNMQRARIVMDTNADSRFIGLSLRYTFGRSKAKSQARSSIQEETDRL